MRFNRDSLIWNLTKMVSILLLFTTIIIGAVYAITFRHTFLEQMEEGHDFTLTQMNNNINNTLSEANIILDRLFASMNLAYYFNGENELTDREIDMFIHNFERHLTFTRAEYHQKYSNVGLFSLNQQFNPEQHFWKHYLGDLIDAPFFEEIVESAELTVYGAVRKSQLRSPIADGDIAPIDAPDNMILPVYRKVFAHNPRRLVGVVEIDIDVADLVESERVTSLPNTADILILDSQQFILLETLPLSDQDRALIQDTFAAGYLYGRLSLDLGRYLMTSRICQDTNITLVALTAERQVLAGIYSRLGGILVIAVLFWFILVFITFTFVRNALKRLVILDRMMAKVGEGDFTVEIHEKEKKDEITRISQTFNRMTARLHTVIEEKVEHEQAFKQAELKALQAQINPHFLHNTLESMRMQCEIDEYYTLGNNLSALSNMFRYSINLGSGIATLAEEFNNLENYLAIMKMRFGDDLTCEIKMDSATAEITVPKMMLQPLVENCFNHGFQKKLPPWNLSICSNKIEDSSLIIIKDNGNGIPPPRLVTILVCLEKDEAIKDTTNNDESIGILNVKQRIERVCSEGSSLALESVSGEGTQITIEIKNKGEKYV